MNDRSMPSYDLIQRVHRLLKQDSYYSKVDLFLRANVVAYETNGSFKKRQDTLAAIADQLRKRASSAKTQRAIKAWWERVYTTIIANETAIKLMA